MLPDLNKMKFAVIPPVSCEVAEKRPKYVVSGLNFCREETPKILDIGPKFANVAHFPTFRKVWLSSVRRAARV